MTAKAKPEYRVQNIEDEKTQLERKIREASRLLQKLGLKKRRGLRRLHGLRQFRCLMQLAACCSVAA